MRTCPPSGLILTFYASGNSLSGTKSTKFLKTEDTPWKGKIIKHKDITAPFGPDRLPIYYTEPNAQTIRDNAPPNPDNISPILHPQPKRPLVIVNDKVKKGYVVRLPRIVYVMVEDLFCASKDNYAGIYARGKAIGHSFADSDITFVVSGGGIIEFLGVTTDVWGVSFVPGHSADRFYGRVLYFCHLTSDVYYYSMTTSEINDNAGTCDSPTDYCFIKSFFAACGDCGCPCVIPPEGGCSCGPSFCAPGCSAGVTDATLACIAASFGCDCCPILYGCTAPCGTAVDHITPGVCTPDSQPSNDYNTHYVFIIAEKDYRAYASTTQQNDDQLFSSRVVIIPFKDCGATTQLVDCGDGCQTHELVPGCFGTCCNSCGCDGSGPVNQVPLANGFGSLPLKSIGGDDFANIDLLTGEDIDIDMIKTFFGLRTNNES